MPLAESAVASSLQRRARGGLALPLVELGRYRDAAGRAVLFGLRPEDFASQPNGGPSLQVVPEVIEPLGSDTLLFFALGGSEIAARVPPGLITDPAQSVTLYPNLAHMHVFDGESGKVI